MAERRHEFDRQLDVIDVKVIELFAMVCEDLPAVTEALLSGSSDMAGQLAARDRAIDVLYREIELLVSREILLQAPVASDLRFLLTVLRIAPELERTHDLECQIASRSGISSPRNCRRAAAGSSSGWANSPAKCGARPRTAGTSGMARPRRPGQGQRRDARAAHQPGG